MTMDKNADQGGCWPLMSFGFAFFFFGVIVVFIQISGEPKTGGVLLWILAAILLVPGGAGIYGAWRIRKRTKADRHDVPDSQCGLAQASSPDHPVPVEQPPLNPGEVRCPSCGHAFVPPRVMLVTQAVTQRYGPNPAQCPKCKHIWSRK
jgi:uncharacterized C2H2 Zn-finger protein